MRRQPGKNNSRRMWLSLFVFVVVTVLATSSAVSASSSLTTTATTITVADDSSSSISSWVAGRRLDTEIPFPSSITNNKKEEEDSIPRFDASSSPSRAERLLDQVRMQHYRQRRRQVHDDRQLLSVSCDTLCVQCVEIPVYFHFMAIPDDSTQSGFILPHPMDVLEDLIVNGNDDARQDLTSYDDMVLMVQQTMEVLNEAFQETPFQFSLRPYDTISGQIISVTSNIEWTDRMLQYGKEIVQTLQRPQPNNGNTTITATDNNNNMSGIDLAALGTLNVYLSYQLGGKNMHPGTIGIATFPSFQGGGSGDGIWMTYSALRGGNPNIPQMNLGYTLAHEVGHWLGLYHVFETTPGTTSCSADNLNDYVDDTGILAEPTRSSVDCQALIESTYDPKTLDPNWPDSCPGDEGDNGIKDPVFNYMNYLDNEFCYEAMGEFTCGQVERMWWQWLLYRQQEDDDSCNYSADNGNDGDDDDDEFRMQLHIVFDNENHRRDENQFIITRWNPQDQKDATSSTSSLSREQQQHQPWFVYENTDPENYIFDSKRDHADEFVVTYVQTAIVVDLCLSRWDNYLLIVKDWRGNGLGPDGSVTLTVFPHSGRTGNPLECQLTPAFGIEGQMEFNANFIMCNGQSMGVGGGGSTGSSSNGGGGSGVGGQGSSGVSFLRLLHPTVTALLLTTMLGLSLLA